MADGDRFEGRLCGTGWRKVYRLACGNVSLDILGDELISAVAAAMRGPLPFPDLHCVGFLLKFPAFQNLMSQMGTF
jgi:hypothetical protein